MRNLFFAVVIAATFTSPAMAQSHVGIGIVPWADLKTTETSTNGVETVYEARLAPIAGNFSLPVTGPWTLDGWLAYSHLYSPDNPPSHPFSDNYVGNVIDAHGAVGYRIFERAKVRAGYSFTYMERQVLVQVNRRMVAVDIENNYMGPFVGASVESSEDSRFIGRGGVDFLFYLKQVDSFRAEANSTGMQNKGIRADVTGGYRIFESLAVTGTFTWKSLSGRDNADGSDAKQKHDMRLFLAQVEFRF